MVLNRWIAKYVCVSVLLSCHPNYSIVLFWQHIVVAKLCFIVFYGSETTRVENHWFTQSESLKFLLMLFQHWKVQTLSTSFPPSLSHSLTLSLSLSLFFVKSEICPKTTGEEDESAAAIRMLGNNRWKAYGASLLRRRVRGPFLIILFSCPPPFPSLQWVSGI